MNAIKRWYYLLFKRKDCMHIVLSKHWFVYGDVIKFTHGEDEYKYLGKGWILKLKK